MVCMCDFVMQVITLSCSLTMDEDIDQIQDYQMSMGILI